MVTPKRMSQILFTWKSFSLYICEWLIILIGLFIRIGIYVGWRVLNFLVQILLLSLMVEKRTFSFCSKIGQQYCNTSDAITLVVIQIWILGTLFFSGDKNPIKIIIFLWFYGFEHGENSNEPSCVIVYSCWVLDCYVGCNWFIKICHGDDSCKKILQHGKEE